MKEYTLSEICLMKSGGTPRRGVAGYYNGNIPWVKISDIENADKGFINFTEELITQVGLDSINNRFFDKGTLLLAMYGSVGKVAIAGCPLSTNQAILGLYPKDNKQLNIPFLKYWFVKKKQFLLNQSQGVALKNISATIVKRQKINLPSLPEQQKIVKNLDTADSLRRKRKGQLKLLDDYIKSVFLEMFGDPVENEKEWKICKLSEFTRHLTSGGRGWSKYYSTKGARFIRSLDVQMNSISDNEVQYVTPPKNKEAERTRIKLGDVLLTITGSRIGRVAVMPDYIEEAYVSQHVAIIRLENINKTFLSYYLSIPEGGQRIILKNQYGQTKPGLSLEQIKEFPVIFPPVKLQNKFSVIFEEVEQTKLKMCVSMDEMDNHFNALMQRYFG